MSEVVVIWCDFLNKMRLGLRVDSKKFDIAVGTGSYGGSGDGWN
jgi:hypothetical protein